MADCSLLPLKLVATGALHAAGVPQEHSCHCRRDRCGDQRPQPAGLGQGAGGAPSAARTAATSSRPSTTEDADDPPLPNSALVNDVVKPARVEAERTFSSVLGRISVEDMAKRAQALK